MKTICLFEIAKADGMRTKKTRIRKWLLEKTIFDAINNSLTELLKEKSMKLVEATQDNGLEVQMAPELSRFGFEGMFLHMSLEIIHWEDLIVVLKTAGSSSLLSRTGFEMCWWRHEGFKCCEIKQTISIPPLHGACVNGEGCARGNTFDNNMFFERREKRRCYGTVFKLCGMRAFGASPVRKRKS